MPLSIELPDILQAFARAIASGLHVALPGVVESYNPLTQSATVKPSIRNPITDLDTGDLDSEEFPSIPNVPICFPRGGGFACYFPLAKGDHVVLIFSDLATGQWRQSGDVSEALDLRRHSLGYAFAIPGAFPIADVLLGPTNPLFLDKMVIGVDNDPTGTIRISSGSVECGGALPVPLALAAPTFVAINALAAALGAVMNAASPGTGTTLISNIATVLGPAATIITKGQ